MRKVNRLAVAKLNAVKQYNKQDHKSKLRTEKYSLLPLNPQQLTPVQTAIQRMPEKHPDFKIEPVNTIQPPEIEFTQTPQTLCTVPISCWLWTALCCYLLLSIVVAFCLYLSCFGCSGDGAIMLGNVVRVYPGTVQGLTFYLGKIYIYN